eukprot:TRINITY_DN1772_c0_g1_i1.p1 TRINITY_DN1772_c0_g1~~TRINITY_DN1772_c0_g1_i1.p1  ORF type:complete len:2798 (+),score=717.51 TRINITY_DN1772_c0_g1_i1:242-8635(+)
MYTLPPSSGFGIKLHPYAGADKHTNANDAKSRKGTAKRVEGRLVASAQWNGWEIVKPSSVSIQSCNKEADTILSWIELAHRFLHYHSSLPTVTRLVEKLAARTSPKIRIELRDNHAFLVNYQRDTITFDTSIVNEINNAHPLGVEPAYALGLVTALALSGGFSEREAIHMTLGLFLSLPSATRSAALTFLDSPFSDPGSTHTLFFKDVLACPLPAPQDLRLDTDTITLEQLLDRERSVEVREKLSEIIKFRDHRASWLQGQLLVDLPYSRAALREAVSVHDIKTRREMAYRVIRDFDREMEKANAERISAQIRNQWLQDHNKHPVIVVGRESRAFSNQATLLANSTYISRTPEITAATTALMQAADESLFIQNLLKTSEAVPPWASEDIFKLANSLKEQVRHLQPALGRIRSLVYGKGGLSPFTQYHGGIIHLSEVLTLFHQTVSSQVDTTHRRVLSALANGVSRNPGPLVVSSVMAGVRKAVEEYSGRGGCIWEALHVFEQAVHNSSPHAHAVGFSVLLQRPSLSGSERFKTNELEPKPEQEEALQQLVRLGGQNLYMTPSPEWIVEATDIIEAVPLFIYERTLVDESGHPVTVFEVDQEGLEQTVRDMASYWARNIDKTMASENAALAREVVLHTQPALLAAAKALQAKDDLLPEVAFRLVSKSPEAQAHVSAIAKVAAWLEVGFDKHAEEVEKFVEVSWQASRFIGRVDALRAVLVRGKLASSQRGDVAPRSDADEERDYVEACQRALKLATDAAPPSGVVDRYSKIALERQRPLPAFHLLTTEAPGLVESFIQVVLEEEMALRNVIQAHSLEDEVRAVLKTYNDRITKVGERVIREYGYDAIVSQYVGQGMPRASAIGRVVSDNLPLQKDVCTLAVLAEVYHVMRQSDSTLPDIDIATQDPPFVDQLMLDASRRPSFEVKALSWVWQQNKTDPEFKGHSITNMPAPQVVADIVRTSDTLTQEFSSFMRWEARRAALDIMNETHPNLHIADRSKRYYRTHTALGLTTARREVIGKHGLHGKLMDPRYAYSCGVAFNKDGRSRPTGGRKRYHFVYGPSRVNLGKDERKSVEVWPQFVGATDPLCAQHARAFYSLINHNPIVRPIAGAENLKVSENQWTALVRSLRNVQALFVERLGVGDIEDLAYQFNQRGGLAVAASKEAEGYMSGPTAGYCIPKDLLFKLFVVTHLDSRKLSQVGIPAHLHSHIVSLMVEITSHQNNFATSGEWEKWAAELFLSPQALSARFSKTANPGDAAAVAKHFSDFVSLAGGVIVLHLPKLVHILGGVGVPSPLISAGKDMHAVLWSNWAEHKITLGGEQVNRSVVFPMTREIPESAKLASRLNPEANLPSEGRLRVHMFGVYKGDDFEKPPPDVRYAWTMRAFLILSGHYKEVALSLDDEGQLIARLSWAGFVPGSKDPEDVKVAEYLCRHFTGRPHFEFPRDQLLVDRLAEAFPVHNTVGDITITTVAGVDSEDLLGFSAETLTLLGDEADRAQEILKTKGISQDQMKANALLRRQFIEKWIPLGNLPASEQDALRQAVGGALHPLALRLRGPGNDFLQDLQGQDVVVFSITHPQLLKLDPAHLRDLMLVGRPNSSLVAADFVCQGRHRVWFERDVMLWYAAGLGIDGQGGLVTRWRDRRAKGRKAVYRAFGWGEDQYQPLLGTDLREEVHRQEARAILAYEICEDVVSASNDEELSTATKKYALMFAQKSGHQGEGVGLLDAESILLEADLAVQYEQRVLLANRHRQRDRVIREALEELCCGMNPSKFSSVHWLAIGGIFLLNGATQAQQKRVLGVLDRAHRRFLAYQNPSASAESATEAKATNDKIWSLISPGLAAATMRLTERKGQMFSVKASEEHVQTAVARRRELALEGVRQLAVKAREDGYASAIVSVASSANAAQSSNPAHTLALVRQTLEAIVSQCSTSAASSDVHQLVGRVMALVVHGLTSIAKHLMPADHDKHEYVHTQIGRLVRRGAMDQAAWDAFLGTYEETGILSYLFEMAFNSTPSATPGDMRWASLPSAAAELLYTLLALEKTSSYLLQARDEIDDHMFWRSLAEFFAKTIDDHFHEYSPWSMDPKRVPLFGRFYDDLGALLPQHREEQYQAFWDAHRYLYHYIHTLVLIKGPSIGKLDDPVKGALLGKVRLSFLEGNTGADAVVTQAIGAGGEGLYEKLWRAYNQIREVAFMRNDGFHLPPVFNGLDPADPQLLDSTRRVNHAFLSPIGRTHFSRALMESPSLNENIVITRTGSLIPLPSSWDGAVLPSTPTTQTNDGAVQLALAIQDAHFVLNEQQYAYALARYHALSPDQVAQRIAADRNAGVIHAKGVRVAAYFSQPMIVGSVVTLHHHPLELPLAQAGYPTTDKNPFLFELTYNKSLYPLIFNPPESSGVHLPPEIDWLQDETTHLLGTPAPSPGESADSQHEARYRLVLHKIGERLRPFAQEHGIIIVKGAAESGARNLQRFDFYENLDQNTAGALDETVFARAVEFIFQVSRAQNVVIQRAIISTPLSWMTEAGIEQFIERQILDHAVAVNLQRHPKDVMYNTLRVILSSGAPQADLHAKENWQVSHLISLTSLQIATNVGRQGTLEMLTPESIRPEFRQTFMRDLEEAGRSVMSAISRFGPTYWNNSTTICGHTLAPYHERYPATPLNDAAGVPLWWPRYLMLDFIAEPLWGRAGSTEHVQGSRMIDVIPGDDTRRTHFTVQDRTGEVFEGDVVGFQFWQLEPNVGVGLWPNFWRRELEKQDRLVKAGQQERLDWTQVGVSDRLVLRNWLAAGRTMLEAKFPSSKERRNAPAV